MLEKGEFLMKSFCIKNNNSIILDYLLNEFENINLDNTYISQNSFKYYKNIIIHYTGKNENLFIIKLSQILTNCIIKFYEKDIIKRLINRDFFYFDHIEKSLIYNNCLEILNSKDSKDFILRNENIFSCLIDYISSHKFFILDGFVNFRLFEYTNLLQEILDIAVNRFVIDKEYKEFIQLLQSYIASQSSQTGLIHIIYGHSEPILLDEDENIIMYDKSFPQPKYLSDISFSSNDYCLNAILNLLPNRIILHMLTEQDEFTTTLQLIFEHKLMICTECTICKTFNLISAH